MGMLVGNAGRSMHEGQGSMTKLGIGAYIRVRFHACLHETKSEVLMLWVTAWW